MAIGWAPGVHDLQLLRHPLRHGSHIFARVVTARSHGGGLDSQVDPEMWNI